MSLNRSFLSRRAVVGILATAGFAGAQRRVLAAPGEALPQRRPIPSSEETIPVIGMGSWITFNVGGVRRLRNDRAEVLRTFFDLGGGMIDSSPMYGSSEEVIGHGLDRIGKTEGLFSATKVWTSGREDGIAQMRQSRALWDVQRFDLMQIHNMLDWETHYETLAEWKAEGRIRYLGITTSHGRRHEDLEAAMKKVPFDFIQLTYNAADREAANRLLPLAADRGIGVIINRPFQRGSLVDRVATSPLPSWAADIGCESWAQILLKYIISHPAVTCAIPATTRVDHMRENMGAGSGPLPDERLRRLIETTVDAL